MNTETRPQQPTTLIALAAAAQAALPHMKIDLFDASAMGRPDGGPMMAAYLPGNPLYTAQCVGLDEATKTMGWAGEQDAGDDLWNWLGTQGWGTRLSPEDSAILRTADALRSATMTEDEAARTAAEAAEEAFLAEHRGT